MSINQLILDERKPWLSARVENLTIDGDTVINSIIENNANSQILTRGAGGILETRDVSTIGGGSGGVTIYSADSTLLGNRVVSGGGSSLRFGNMGTFEADSGAESITLSGTSGTTTISSSSLRLNGTTLDNAASEFLCRNPVNGEVTRRVVSSLANQNIYNIDGVLTGNRELSGDNNELTISDVSLLTVEVGEIDVVGDVVISSIPSNNSNTELLAVNSGTGRIERRDVSTLPVQNIYNTSGSVTDNRRVDGDNYTKNLNFTQFGLVSVDANTVSFVQPLNDAPSDTIFITQSPVGILQSRKEETINGINIYSQDGTLADNRKLTGDGFNLTVSSIGNLGVEANTIELFNAPSVNNANTQLLTRSAAGLVELRDVSSLPGGGSTSRYANLAMFRLTTAIGGYQTIFNNNGTTIQTTNRLFVPGPSTRKYLIKFNLLYNYLDNSNGPIIGPTLTNLSTGVVLYKGNVPRNNYLSIIPYTPQIECVIDGNTQFSIDTFGNLDIVAEGVDSVNANTVMVERIE